MPLYDYTCKKCGHLWEEMQTIKGRSKPTKKACPECEEKGSVFQTLASPPSTGNPSSFSVAKTDSGFQEVLSKIGQNHPNHNMSQFMKGSTTRGKGGHG
jgi:putative FmdB family regulatory protein